MWWAELKSVCPFLHSAFLALHLTPRLKQLTCLRTANQHLLNALKRPQQKVTHHKASIALDITSTLLPRTAHLNRAHSCGTEEIRVCHPGALALVSVRLSLPYQRVVSQRRGLVEN